MLALCSLVSALPVPGGPADPKPPAQSRGSSSLPARSIPWGRWEAGAARVLPQSPQGFMTWTSPGVTGCDPTADQEGGGWAGGLQRCLPSQNIWGLLHVRAELCPGPSQMSSSGSHHGQPWIGRICSLSHSGNHRVPPAAKANPLCSLLLEATRTGPCSPLSHWFFSWF